MWFWGNWNSGKHNMLNKKWSQSEEVKPGDDRMRVIM